MDRNSEDIAADSILRPEFVSQESLDEFIARQAPWLGTEQAAQTLATHGLTEEDVCASLTEEWAHGLDPKTNLSEMFYLEGFTDKTQRLAALDQSHAELREAVAKAGIHVESLGI